MTIIIENVVNPVLKIAVEYANCTSTVVIIIAGISIFFIKSPRILNTLPAFSTGIGVLFTFAVLYYTLTNENLKINEIRQVESLVKDLAKAFSTSLIGITGSLIFSFATKIRLDHLEKKEGLNEHPAKILKILIQKTEENTGEVEKLRRIISILSKRSERKIQTLFQKVDTELAAHVNLLSRESTKVFKEELEESTSSIVAQHNKVIEKGTNNTLNLLKEQTGALEKSFQALADLQVRSTSALESSSALFSQAVAQYHELQQETHALVDKIKGQQKSLEKLTSDTGSLLNVIEERSEGILELQAKVNDISRTILQLDSLREKLEQLHPKV